MLSDREKVVVGTCLLVILATVVTGCLVLFTGDGKAPSGTGQLSGTSGPQTLLNGQTAPGQQGSSLSGQGSLQGQTLSEQQAPTSQQQSNSTTQDQQSAPTGGTVSGAWLLNLQGKVYNFPPLPVTLKTNGTVSLEGANSPYVQIKDSHYTFDAASRAIMIQCNCEITVPQSGVMPVTLTLYGSFESGLKQATGNFAAETNSTPTDQGTFKLYH
jgi:hypothetical protein